MEEVPGSFTVRYMQTQSISLTVHSYETYRKNGIESSNVLSEKKNMILLTTVSVTNRSVADIMPVVAAR